jgi:YbbR domain-containing protein
MRSFAGNLALKAGSLGLAVLLWFVIAGEKTSEMGLQVPVELQNFPKDLELTGDPVDAIEVRLRATPGIVQRLSGSDVSAQVDLAGVLEGERIVHLTSANIRVPFGVKVVRINPAIVRLHFERTQIKTVPIRPRVLGRPAAGLEVAEVTSQPPDVQISGPKSRVQEVESAFTEPVSVEGAQTTVTDDVNLGLEDPVLRIQGTPRVRVTALVREAHEKRTFDALPVAVRGGNASVQPSRVRVVLEGPVSALKLLKPGQVRPYVELTGAQGLGKRTVAVELVPGAAGVAVHHTEPAEVALRPASRGE